MSAPSLFSRAHSVTNPRVTNPGVTNPGVTNPGATNSGTATPAFATAYSQPRRSSLFGGQADPDAGPADPFGALDSVDRLALSLADLCRSAVDPLAIVAGLEAEGYNDRIAAERFGVPDLFALADELHLRVPRELDPPEPAPPQPTATGTARAILRGLLFAAPSLCAMAFLVTDLTGAARVVLAIVQVLAWGYGQGVAHLAYNRLNNADRRGADQILRIGTLYALLVSTWLLVATQLVLGTALTALLPAATSLWFCLAAIPALVLSAEFAMAATLAPAVLGALAAWLGAPAFVALAGAQVSVAATTLFMLRLTRRAEGARPRLTRAELRSSLPHALSGLGIGTLITVVLAGPVAQGSAAAGQGLVAVHAAIVLTLGMGAGEWHARWYQRQVSALLSALADPAGFPPPATLLLLGALVRQAATTAALAVIVYCLFDRADTNAAGLYCFAVALAPGLLAALFLRGIEARAALWPTALALAATLAALPSRNAAVLAALALEASVLLAIRAAAVTARPWVHL
jgi:hypothetical protein